jgi:peptidyl-prolyl cis-trans isomerase A (cyclophilin A)
MRQLHALLFIAIITSSSLLSSTALAANPILTFETNRGNFIVELYPEKAPKTVANFIRYVNAGFYKDTIFHRVISGFMIQGGGFTSAMVEKETQAPVENEANNGMVNDVGAMAMARTSDPNSATAQFFINLGNNQTLNYQGDDAQLIGYCVFGRVVKGMDVVRDIGVTPTGNLGPFSDVPKSAVVVYQVKLNN